MSWKEYIPSCIYSVFLIVQMVLAYLFYNNLELDSVANIGWLLLTISGIFGWLPIITFRKKGGVPKGKSYIYTTVLVESGIYSIVRHPQYCAGIIMSIALVFITQYWINLILFFPIAIGFYLDSLQADKKLVEKFGIKYEQYMEKVPGMNPIKGIIRILKKNYTNSG